MIVRRSIPAVKRITEIFVYSVLKRDQSGKNIIRFGILRVVGTFTAFVCYGILCQFVLRSGNTVGCDIRQINIPYTYISDFRRQFGYFSYAFTVFYYLQLLRIVWKYKNDVMIFAVFIHFESRRHRLYGIMLIVAGKSRRYDERTRRGQFIIRIRYRNAVRKFAGNNEFVFRSVVADYNVIKRHAAHVVIELFTCRRLDSSAVCFFITATSAELSRKGMIGSLARTACAFARVRSRPVAYPRTVRVRMSVIGLIRARSQCKHARHNKRRYR